MEISTQLKQVLASILNQSTDHFNQQTPLLGNYAELDSMGIMTLLLALESSFGINMNDIELSADTFATLGDLQHAIEQALQLSTSAA